MGSDMQKDLARPQIHVKFNDTDGLDTSGLVEAEAVFSRGR